MYERSPKDQVHIQRFLSANCFGDYYTRNGVDISVREMITLSILIALGGVESQIKGHIQGNLNIGKNIGAVSVELTPADLGEIDDAAAKIAVQGARYPEKLEQMTGR
ncbi:MAG: carboxymuconolactone decarboxylase family protein [Nostoc sp.]